MLKGVDCMVQSHEVTASELSIAHTQCYIDSLNVSLLFCVCV